MKRLTIALAVAVLAATGFTAGVSADGREADGLTGTWRVTITLKDCVTGTPRPPFRSLLTFGSDGTLVETTNNPAFRPGQRGPGHGAWDRVGGRTFSAASEAFIMFSSDPSPAPPSPGFTKGLQRISQTITLTHDSPNAFSSVASVQFFDDAGTLLNEGCATAVGSRFGV